MSLVADPNNIRLAMLGMVDGNGHPYSWSAIINGRFDREVMSKCPYPVIPQYLSAQPPEALGIPGARVTHIWCEDPAAARDVANASYIEHVVERPEDVIGKVDAVIIPTDKGEEHVERARPFIDAGLPVFVDKPMVASEEGLQQFVRWHREGKPLLSTSCMRYSREFQQVRSEIQQVGHLRLLILTMCKSWERYGIHALEGVYPFLEPGRWHSVTNSGDQHANIVHVRHASGVEVLLPTIADLYGAFGNLSVYGDKGSQAVKFSDTFHAFKAQLAAFIEYLRTGRPPFEFSQTIELMKIIIAGIRSREQGGRCVLLSEISEGQRC